MTGRVLSIERMCVHDGPGIRTTVFLKGCPLHCRWCHNPESVSPEPEIGLSQRKCLGCRKCAEVCPSEAHAFDDGVHTINRDACTACGRCVEACLPGALSYYGRQASAEETAAAVLEDRTFYAVSGGGCTLSGGEPLAQSGFCRELCGLLQSEGIHCAIDTSGAVPWECFEAVLPYAGLFLYDVKHTDEGLHREHTGRSNHMVLGNLRRLAGCGLPIEVRIPLIPGFNADEGSLAAIGELLSQLPNLVGVRLLPYHLARQKYEAVGRPDTMPDEPPPDAAAVARAAAALRQCGLTTVP